MALMYTSLPPSSPIRQRYQRIIDNSSALIAKRWGRDGTNQNANSVNTDWAKTLNNMYSSGIDRYSPYGERYSGWDAIENAIERQQGAASKNRKIEKNEETLSATVRNGKIVGSSGNNQKQSSGSDNDKNAGINEYDSRRELQTNLMDLYNLMRGSFFNGFL